MKKEDVLTKGWHHIVISNLDRRYFKICQLSGIPDLLENLPKEHSVLLASRNSQHTLINKDGKLYMQKKYQKPVITYGDFYLDLKPSVKKLYFPNVNIEPDGRLHSIPLGLISTQLDDIMNFIDRDVEKDILVYANFNYKVGEVRKNLAKIIPDMDFVFCHGDIYRGNRVKKKHDFKVKTYSKDIVNEYYDCLSRSKFCFCTCGHEPNTFRLWESSYLGSIPLVEDIPFFKHFEDDIPLLRVKDFSKLTKDYLEEKYEEISKKNYSRQILKKSYWQNRWKNEIEEIKDEEQT